MPTADSANPLVAKCLPRLAISPERSTGLTVCDVGFTTINEFDTLYKKGSDYRVDHAILEADFIGKACKAVQEPLEAFLMANQRQWSRDRLPMSRDRAGRLRYAPFVRMSRTGPINNNWWQFAYVSGPTTGNYVYDMTTSTGIPLSTNWFQPRMRIHLRTINKEDGTSVFTQFQVVSAVISGSAVRVTCTPAQAGSTAPAGSIAIPGVGDILGYGTVLRGTANINEYDDYCPEDPGINTNQEAYFWTEWNRIAVFDSEVTQEYMELLMDGNPYWQKFIYVPEVEYNRQVMSQWSSRNMNQFLFGKATNANQTAVDWENLPDITLDAKGSGMAWDGQCIGKRADAVGVLDQLFECDRVWDLQRQPLSLPSLFEKLYEIKRMRESQGISCDMIELGMDSQFAIKFATAMVRYFNMRGEGLLRLNRDLPNGKASELGFFYTDFKLDYPQGLILRVVTSKCFDDQIDAHRRPYQDGDENDYNLADTAGMIWIIDWSTTYRSVLESSKVTNKSASAQELAAVNGGFMCVAKVPKYSIRITSQCVTNVMECPAANLLIIGFDRCVVPTHEGDFCGNAFMSGWDPSA
jgi:hypothetical protein